jgi:hypothetical protein
MTLEEMIKIYNECTTGEGIISNCSECPLFKPVHEYGEHPTFCEIISDLENNN